MSGYRVESRFGDEPWPIAPEQIEASGRRRRRWRVFETREEADAAAQQLLEVERTLRSIGLSVSSVEVRVVPHEA